MSILVTIVLGFLAAIAVLGPLVALHEWGHFIVARLCGVKVLTYSIGFGPKIASWVSPKTGIDYRLSVLPLGGYVKMLDEREGEVDANERHLAFNTQHPLKKIAIVAAGPLMNFIIAIGLFWVLFLTPTEQLKTRVGSILPNTPAAAANLNVGDEIIAIDGHHVQTWEEINYRLANRIGESGYITITTDAAISSTINSAPNNESKTESTDNLTVLGANLDNQTENSQAPIHKFMQGENSEQDAITSFGALPWQPTIPPVIGQLAQDGVAVQQGMRVGDTIQSINGQKIDDWISATRIIKSSPEKWLDIRVLRDGVSVNLKVMPQAKKDNMGNTYGLIGAGVEPIVITVPEDFKTHVRYNPVMALAKSFDKTAQLAVMTVSSMGKMISGAIGLDNLSGPITIASVAKQSFEISWQMVLSTAALISLSLAVLNLLPIPVLDGGHLVYYTIELIGGKPVSEQMQIVGSNIGLVLLVGFMMLAIFNDVSRFL